MARPGGIEAEDAGELAAPVLLLLHAADANASSTTNAGSHTARRFVADNGLRTRVVFMWCGRYGAGVARTEAAGERRVNTHRTSAISYARPMPETRRTFSAELEKLHRDVVRLGVQALEAVHRGSDALLAFDLRAVDEVIAHDAELDALSDSIE